MSPESHNVCPECDAPLSSDDLFCPHCLACLPPMTREGPTPAPRLRVAVLVQGSRVVPLASGHVRSC
ncbi:MAG: hypothetical protein H8E35_07640 [Ardenticatenia bacterium]|nr:hypothetical protein [Ardenticatenia bacterium]